jgi:hypothetical protein
MTAPEAAGVALAAGGRTMTGPDGGRDAMAGAGGAVTICGACRGCGTTLRGAEAGRFGAAMPDETELGTGLDAVEPEELGVDVVPLADGAATAAVAGGADCLLAADAAAMAGDAPGRPSRCSFCCWIARKTSPGLEMFDRSIFGL